MKNHFHSTRCVRRQAVCTLRCLHALSLLLLGLQLVQGQGVTRDNPSWLPSNKAAVAGPVRPGAGVPAAAVLANTRPPSAGAAAGAGSGLQPTQARAAGPPRGSGPPAGAKRRRRVSPVGPKAAAGVAAGTAAVAAAGAAGSKPVRASSATANPAGSLHNILAKNTPMFRSLFTVLDIGADQIPDTAVGTFFAPSDDAITAFLQDMGLTAQQLAARPELVDLILSYHFVPGYQVQGTGDVADGSKVLLTGDEQYIARLGAAAGGDDKLVVSDVQKNKANVVEGPFIPDNNDGLTVYIIDKVLKSANYFRTVEAALSHSPYWISTKNAVVKANLLPTLEASAVTMLVPDNAAFKPLESNLTRASPGRLADLLKYHVLPKVRRIPKGFQSGPADTLLTGHPVDINVTQATQVDPFSGDSKEVPLVTITPEVGRAGKVTYFNIYAGRSILHGINTLLLPDLPADPNEAPLPDDDAPPEDEEPPADVAEEAGPKTAGASSSSSSSSRRTADDDDVRPPAGAAAPKAAAATTKGSIRGQRPATTPPDEGDGSSDSTPTAPASTRAGSSRGATPAGAAAAAGGRMQGGGVAGGPAARRPAVPTAVATMAADAQDTTGRRLLALPNDMLAAGLQSARRLLHRRQLSQRSRARSDALTAPSGALSSAVNVGAIGELQTFANGITTSKTLTALQLSARPKVPKQYVNRYGSFKGPKVKGGCLNCKAWGKQAQ